MTAIERYKKLYSEVFDEIVELIKKDGPLVLDRNKHDFTELPLDYIDRGDYLDDAALFEIDLIGGNKNKSLWFKLVDREEKIHSNSYVELRALCEFLETYNEQKNNNG